MIVADVSKLAVVPIDRTGRPQPSVIAFVEGLLERASRGEIQSIAVAYTRANGYAGTGTAYGERPDDCYAIGTAILCLQHDFVCEMEQGTRPAETPPPSPAA
jgi:hypothetical protein